jgi:predicted ATPase/DNA-binding CsgD family transcriptional regulator
MVRRLPVVADHHLRLLEEPSAPVVVGSEAWYRWLAAEPHQSFAFKNQLGTFTVRRERQRHGWYWYLYRKQEGKLRKAYLGKTEALTVERLTTVAASLVSRGEPQGDADANVRAPRNPADWRAHADPTPIRASAYFGETERSTKHSLPAQPTPLIGRGQEVQTVRQLLTRRHVRLLTLTGVAGVGKTRLALQVAAELLDGFAEGVFFVPLAPLSDPALVLPTIAQILALREVGDRGFLDLLKASLQDKQLLLVLDNFEQVVSAALVIAELLAAAPRLHVLVTSRTSLHLSGEHELVVPPLALPDLRDLPPLDRLTEYGAIRLFVERAQAVQSDFALTEGNAAAVAAICHQLDGLPLAIELAAGRSKLFSPQALLPRLKSRLKLLVGGAQDLPLRQQTLRKTIDWSYDLLEEDEKSLFRRLAVFVGGCTLEAAEAVCNAQGDLEVDVPDAVVRLIDKSLLQQAAATDGEPRVLMLETIREYALERLKASGETEAMRRQHATLFLQLAEESFPKMNSAEQPIWFKRLEADHDNLRAAMQFVVEQEGTEPRREMALRLGVALQWFWFTRGYFSEGKIFLERALRAQEGVASAVVAKALDAAAELAFDNGDLERSEELSKKSLALFQEQGDIVGIASCLFNLGSCARLRCQYATARSQLEEAAVLFQQVGDTWKRGRCLTNLARLFTTRGEYDRSRAVLEESLEIYRTLGVQERIGLVLCLQAEMLFLSGGNLTTAQSLAEQSLPLIREGGNTWLGAHALDLLAQIFLQQGKTARARELCEESLATFKGEESIYRDMPLLSLARVVAREGDLAAAQQLYRKSLALARAMGTNDYIAFCLEGLAAVVAAQGEPRWAARLWGTAEARCEALGTPLPPVYRADYERAVAAARTQLGEKFFAAAWAEGRTLTPEQALTAQGHITLLQPLPAAPAPTSSTKPATTYPDGLTAREVEVLRLVALGLTNPQIAEQLVISPQTVHAHLRSMYSKLGVTTRSAATRLAVEHHLV